MKELKITDSGPNGDYHICYLNSETGIGAMSPGKDGHSHDLIYVPPVDPTPEQPEQPGQPPQIDSTTGQPVVDPMTGMPSQGTPAVPAVPANPGAPGYWVVRPAGAAQNPGNPAVPTSDMHDHQLLDYRPNKTKVMEDDKQILDDCMSLWREGIELVSDCVKKGRESEDFYANKQWDDKISKKMEALDRAALTINEIGPNVDTLIGYQMEQRTDIKYLPQEGGDQRCADMYNVVVKKILDACYFGREETKVFKDIVVPGFGAFNVYLNFFEDIQGEIIVERFPWDDIVYGPHEKEDLSDCEFEVRSRMTSIAKIKQLFPKKAKEIEESYNSYKGVYPSIQAIRDDGFNGTNTDYRYAKKIDDTPVYTINGTFPLVDVQKKQFRLAQCTKKLYEEVTVAFDSDDEFFQPLYDWKDKDIALVSTIPGFQVISQLRTRMRITKFCGSVVLSDENPAELPKHDFYTVPVYGYRQNGEFWGKVESAKDPQRELNKRRSQMMDTMNRLGASVYYVEPDTFKDNNEKEKFKTNRSKPGAIFDVNDRSRIPVLEEGAQFPAALVQIMQLDQENLQRLMNVVVGQQGANESDALFLDKKQARMTGNQFLFDNLSFAKQKLGKILLPLVQRYYPPERMERMLNSQYSKSKFTIGGDDYSQFTPDEIVEILGNDDILEYDVIVSESSFAPSTRLGIAKTLFELIQKGAAVPPELALQFIDMPADTRAQISDTLQQQTQQSVQDATNKGNAEIIKTLIAKGEYTVTPEKAQELGLVPTNGQLPNGAPPPNNTDNSQVTEYTNNQASALSG